MKKKMRRQNNMQVQVSVNHFQLNNNNQSSSSTSASSFSDASFFQNLLEKEPADAAADDGYPNADDRDFILSQDFFW